MLGRWEIAGVCAFVAMLLVCCLVLLDTLALAAPTVAVVKHKHMTRPSGGILGKPERYYVIVECPDHDNTETWRVPLSLYMDLREGDTVVSRHHQSALFAGSRV